MFYSKTHSVNNKQEELAIISGVLQYVEIFSIALQNPSPLYILEKNY